MVFTMRLASVRAMQIPLIGTGGVVGTARHPTLHIEIAKRATAIAGPKAAGAMMIPATGRTQCVWYSLLLSLL